jgi:hypothetical protein
MCCFSGPNELPVAWCSRTVQSLTALVVNSVDAVISLGTSETPKPLFGPLKQNMSGGQFHNNREVEMVLNKWFRLQELKATQVEFLNHGSECARGLCCKIMTLNGINELYLTW